MLPLGDEHGFLRLPGPARGDLFLDLEGDRLALDGGREYLVGVSDTRDAYTPLWATNPAEEKRAFEQVVDRILAAFATDKAMHVYHFGAYEPTAFKRLSGRYATRETELDTILRAELFVDLHTIVRHSLRASVETYSLKDLEQFYGLTRVQDLREATASRRALEWAIEMREDLGLNVRAPVAAAPAAEPQLELGLDAAPAANRFAEHIAIVERYNRDDCVSAARLRDWLEELRAAAERAHSTELPRPELHSGEASEQVAEAAEETQRVMEALLAGVPVDATDRDEEQQARWLMAQLLEWHRREEKAAWWEYFRLLDLPLEDYEDERSALAGPRVSRHRRRRAAQARSSLRVPAARARRAPRRRGLRAHHRQAARQDRRARHRGAYRRRRAHGTVRGGAAGASLRAPHGVAETETERVARDRSMDRRERRRRRRPASRRARSAAEARAAARARLARPGRRARTAVHNRTGSARPPSGTTKGRHRARRGA